MILEALLILGVIGIIFLFFQKQAVQEFRILQTESLDKALPLLHERCPIVVLPAPQPQNLWTSADIAQRPSLGATAINGKTLKDAIQQDSFPLTIPVAQGLAERVGIPVWVKQTLLPTFQQSAWWTPALSSRTEVAIGAQGLRQTQAYWTILIATEGALAVSLLNESANAYLPPNWRGKRISKMTRDDAPLLGQIEQIDVIVRPGSALMIPPHWKVCWENYEKPSPSLSAWVEIHHPMSRFVQRVAAKRGL